MKWSVVVKRFWEGRPAKGGGWCHYHGDHYRDVVEVDGDIVRYLFHGHEIATYYKNTKILKLDNCGYATSTTRDRLNAIMSFGYICNILDSTYLSYNGDLHELPVVFSTEDRKILSSEGEYRLVPKIGRRRTEHFGKYLSVLYGAGIVKLDGHYVNLDRVLVFEDGMYAPVIRGRGIDRVKYAKYYGRYLCRKLDGQLPRPNNKNSSLLSFYILS